MGRNWSGTEGGDRSSIRDVLTMELAPLTREVGIERRLQAAGRIKGSLRTHVLVHLTRPPAAVLVVPEVHVITALDLLDPEATADLHGEGMELPLHKGNCEVAESQVPSVRRPALLTFSPRTGLRHWDDELSPLREGMEEGFLGAKNRSFRHPVIPIEELLRPSSDADRRQRSPDELVGLVPMSGLPHRPRTVLRTCNSPTPFGRRMLLAVL